MLWRRHVPAPDVVFSVELDLDAIQRDLAGIVRDVGPLTEKPEVSLALLDADGAVVAQTVPGFSTDWARPLVATEVGEMLPHWEVAAYLLDPDSVTAPARAPGSCSGCWFPFCWWPSASAES